MSLRGALLASIAFVPTIASAQSTGSEQQAAPPPPAAEAASTVDEVVVQGFRASLERALNIKRNASGISDAITAEDIGKFPDLNISESLQRIPGVTLERNAFGEGRAINLRGLGPQFTLVEVNGVTGTSNNDGGRSLGNSEGSGGRSFSFEVLASELFTGAVVNKTSLASQTEGGLAGTVSLQTPRPLEQKDGFHLSASALANYSGINEQTDPRGAVLLSYNAGKYGFTASVSYADTTYRSDTIEGGSWRAFSNSNTGPIKATADVGALLVANGPRYYYVKDHRKTFGSTLAFQARPTDELELTIDGIYGKLDSRRNALRDDMAIEGGANAPTNITVTNGAITKGDFTNIQQRVGANFYTTDEEFYQASASAKWTPAENWTITPMVGYSSRKNDSTFNLYSFRLANSAGVFDPGTVSYAVRGDYLDFGSTATDFKSNPQNFLFNTFAFRPTSDEDNEFSTKLDVERKFDTALKTVRFGVRYSDRDKTRQAFDTRLNRIASVPTTGLPSLAAAYTLVDFDVRGGGASVPNQLLNVDEAKMRALFLPNGLGGAPITGTVLARQVPNEASGTYQVGEKTLAGYAETEFEVDTFNLVAGLRFVRTEQTATGNRVVNANLPTQQITPVTVEQTYQFFLPSLTAKWEVVPDVILRAAYGRTLTRPNLGDVAPRESFNGIDASGGRGTMGNPELTPYTADNFDLGGEWYLGRGGLIGANVFYKDIKDFIDTTSFVENRTFPRQADAVLVTGPITFVRPVNGVSAKIKGFELTAQSRLDFVSDVLRNFGFVANYSYTESSADFATAGDVRSGGLPGLSKNSYNLVGYYDNGRFDARFSYSWRARFLAEFNSDFGIPRFTDPYGQLDFSANYEVTDNFSLQAQVLNLTRSQRTNKSSAFYLPFNVEELDRRIFVGGRVKF
jgi:TonB-dependent receptor